MIRSRTSWKARDHVLTIGERTLIMGVLNVTPDSFSDGGKFLDPDAAVERALEMEAQGADIIDIGAESTRPGSERINAGEELRRLVPVLKRLKGKLTVPISVDTYKVEVAEKALEHGASIINDVSALTWEPDLAKPVVQADAGLILNHMRGTPETWSRLAPIKDIVGTLVSELEAAVHRATRAGVPRDHVVIDPGIGFGKRGEQNFEILARLGELLRLGVPVLVAASRKSFLGNPDDPRALEFATAAAVTSAILQGAAIVRVHDVAAMRPVAHAVDAIVAAIPEREEKKSGVVRSRAGELTDEEKRRTPIRPVVATPPPKPAAKAEEPEPSRRPFERRAETPERKPVERKAYEPRPERDREERKPFDRRSGGDKPERRPYDRTGAPTRGREDRRAEDKPERRSYERSGPPSRGRDDRPPRAPFRRADGEDRRAGDKPERRPYERSGPPSRGREDRPPRPPFRRADGEDRRGGDKPERRPYERSGPPSRGREDRPARPPFRRADGEERSGGRPGGRPSGPKPFGRKPSGPRKDDRPPFGGPKRGGGGKPGGDRPGGRGPTKRPGGGGPPRGPRKRT